MYKIRFKHQLCHLARLTFIFSLFFSIFLFSAKLKAQIPLTVTIGNSAGPSNWFYGPIMRSSSNANLLNYSRHAYIYTASELGSLGLAPGARILKLEWLKQDGGTIVIPNTFNVFLTNTNATSFPTSVPWSTLITGATQTYANTSFPVTIGNQTYLEAPFNVPGNDSFTYTGSNLQILTDWFKGGLQTGNGIRFYSYSTGSSGKAIGIASANPISGTTPALQAGTYGNQRPTIRITYLPVPPCAGVPNTGMAISSASTVCPNVPFTLSIQNTIPGGGVSFVWQRADDSAFTTNVANVGSSATLTTSQTSAQYFRCVASCSGSGLSFTSNPVFVPMSLHYQCYCNTSTAISSADEEIFNFKFGTLDNSSNCSTTAPGPGSSAQLYSNYQGLTPPNVEILSDVPFSIEVGTCLNFYPNRSGIFIDYNKNGVYETTEQVYSTPSPISGPHTESGIIQIPLNALTGITGLRVITIEQSGAVSSPCLSYSWGETEDYLINIVPTTICSGVPNPGNTIASALSTCVNTSVLLSIQNLTIGQLVSYQWCDGNGPISGATASTYNTYPITDTTTFHCIVTCNASNSSDTSTPVIIVLNGFIDCYCKSEAGNDADEDIFSFLFNGTTYSTDCNTTAPGAGSILGRYSNFHPLNVIDTLDLGASVPFDIEVDDCDQAPYYSFGTAIWIDFNRNGVYTDLGERVFFEPSPIIGPRHIIGNIPISCLASEGETGMRITIAEQLAGPTLTPCLLYGFGETEDYKIYLKKPNLCDSNLLPGNTQGTVTSFCDSASSILSLAEKCLFENFTYQWFVSSPLTSPYVAIAGATSKTYETPMLTSSAEYRCRVSCGGAQPKFSTPLTIHKITILPTTVASINTYCVGDSTPVTLSTTFTVTGLPKPVTYTYAPNDPLYLTVNSNIAFAKPPVTTTYTITVTNSNGCFGTTTVTVNAVSLTWYLDVDNDGYYLGAPIVSCTSPGVGYNNMGLSAGDCDDNNQFAHQTFPFFLDNDGDGFGTGLSIDLCVANANAAPVGYALVGNDCDDNNNLAHDNFAFYIDIDGDGYGVGNVQNICAINANTPPSGYATLLGDCNDNNNTIHDNFSFYIDNDGDGFGVGNLLNICAIDANTPPTGYALLAGDCDDNNSLIYQSFPFYLDNDGDGYGVGNLLNICAVDANTPPTGYAMLVGDCDDNNILIYQNFSFYLDNDGDGFGVGNLLNICAVDANTPPTGYALQVGDCDDNNALIYQNYSFYLDNDGDGYGVGNLLNICAVNANTPPTGYALLVGDCDDNNALINQSFPFYLDNDGDAYGVGNLLNICAVDANTPPTGYALVAGDCDDNNNLVFQSFPFYLDNDGDGYGTGSAQTFCAVNASTPPTGYASLLGDCDDNNNLVFQSFPFYLDNDGDAYGVGNLLNICAVDANTPPTGYALVVGDCDDNNNLVYQNFPFYIDNDSDGYGTGNAQIFCAINANTPPTGYATLLGDCDDNNNLVYQNFPFYLDNDGDGYGTGNAQIFCAINANTPPTGYTSIAGDCDDNNNLVYQNFPFYLDNDADGYGIGTAQTFCAINANTPPTGYATLDGDCNDNNNLVSPGSPEICANGIDDNCNLMIDEGCSLVLNIKLFIEGYYAGGGLMNPVLLNQSVSTNPLACDSADVALHDAVSPFGLVATQRIAISTNGIGSAIYIGTPPNAYYIAITHRNALQTWSSNPVLINSTTYNFTDSATKAFGSNMTEVEPGVWAFYSGELNADDNIDILDLSILEADVNNFEFGYIPTDLNGDGGVDLLDSPMLELNSNNFVFSSRP